MSTLFKDVYSEPFYNQFSEVVVQSVPSFDPAKFKRLIFDENFIHYELKERMTHTAKSLHHFLPDDFEKATGIIQQIIQNLRAAGMKEDSLEFMFFPEYISMYGIDDYEHSVAAIEWMTQFTSCEFAVRPYIIKYESKMLDQMLAWSKHENNNVRRLASEGSRPRLPWAMSLPRLKQDPSPLLPILENLKQDPSAIVRRSVANNLNDISKDNPEVVLNIAKKWKGKNKERNALVKHACRTLLKQGNQQVLELFGFNANGIKLSETKIITPKVTMGNNLSFSFSVMNQAKKSRMVRLEYGLYYKKKNGSLAKKVFKISEREIKPNQVYSIQRKQSFKLITTRIFYPGKHELSLIVNGKETKVGEFQLVQVDL